MITKVDIVRDMRRVHNEIGEAPTERQYNEHGEYSAYTVRDRFGSLAAARQAAGLDSGVEKGMTKDDIAEDLERVAEIVDRPPSQAEYDEYGGYTVRTVHNKFESWIAARGYSELGEGPEREKRRSDEELLSAIRDLAVEIGDVPTQLEMRNEGRFSDIVYRDRFSSWNNAVRKAGFEPRQRGAPAGKRNGAHKGGSVEGFYGPNWEEQRQKCLERDGYQCQHCGMTLTNHQDKYGSELNIHHIHNRRRFIEDGEFDWKRANRLQNLVALCNTHHGQYDHSGGLRPHNVMKAIEG